MSHDNLTNMAAGARAAIADPARISLVGSGANPRFELFHAASSLCSQKVRTVLFEKQLPYRSNDMMILGSMGPDGLVPAEHYHPPYVRLRLLAGREVGREFVSGYSGRTSVETEGFDPCTVPLLVDYEAGRVIADSKRICCYLDAVSRDPIDLVPEDADARARVMHQVSIVDQLPNGTLLYGFHPDADRRPEALKTAMETVYDYKIQALEAMIDANADDAELVAAYRAKIAKERGGKSVRRDAAFQRAARRHVAGLLTDLDHALGSSSPYLRGESFSLGDVLWGVNLVRMAYLGLASMWKGLPNVERYVDALAKRPSLCKEAVEATVDSMPPSRYMHGMAGCGEAVPV
ncbi:glutathione S-transferase [Cupriavidus necator]|uniref:Glutathione S-transferase n=1 Tax=Cupriavidus necator TaxID=106590 RepID=A0A367PHP9_CUPNE|nr:glutathione S-transferase [Cupriavidus necator]QQX86936.1 glutathione S-transferase [Cupriavidus necator]RCJ07043.1 glutathione S-transferase [Cupriavidus necator]